ncbi:hypothetical protein H5410_051935, partial [Solanum commersonii]
DLLGLLIFLEPQKRLKSDVIDTPPFKRPICSSHGESSGSSIDPVVALSYLREIKDTFVDQVEKYDMFLDVIKDLKARSLLLALDPLLPYGCDINLNDEVKPLLKKSIHFEQVFNFVSKIKKRLVNNHEYKSFIGIMNKCRKERKDFKEVYQEVAVLLSDHPDLLDEFSGFLPDSVTTNPLSNLNGDKKYFSFLSF